MYILKETSFFIISNVRQLQLTKNILVFPLSSINTWSRPFILNIYKWYQIKNFWFIPKCCCKLYFADKTKCLNVEMNSESSRSHLVIGIIIETTNRATGQVLKGKVRTTVKWLVFNAISFSNFFHYRYNYMIFTDWYFTWAPSSGKVQKCRKITSCRCKFIWP